MAEGGNIHGGHRARLREQFLRAGLDSMSDVQVLELLLFFAIPRRDTNPIAHRLLERFGSLSAVFEAPVTEISRVEGVGESAALLLCLVPQAARRHLIDRAKFEQVLDTTEKCGRYLLPFFHGERDEVVYLLCLSVRKIVEAALTYNATSVVLAHNHVSGIALPSREDEATTRQIRTALDAVGILLADHVVVADDDFVSMADNGLFL